MALQTVLGDGDIKNALARIVLGVESMREDIKDVKQELEANTSYTKTLMTKKACSEFRECYDTPEIQAICRFVQQWLAGEEATLSAKHLQAILFEVRRSQMTSATSLGYQHHNKDLRRAHFLAASIHTALVEGNEAHEMIPEHGQQGVLAHKLPQFREMLKTALAKTESGEDLPFKELPESLVAMFELLEPVSKQYRPVAQAEHQKTFLSEADREKLAEKGDGKDVKAALDKLPEVLKDPFSKCFPGAVKDGEVVCAELFSCPLVFFSPPYISQGVPQFFA